MKSLYTLGILCILLVLNIPEIRGDMRNKVTVYRPQIELQLQTAKDKAEPVMRIIMQNVLKNSTVIKGSNGVTKRIINTTVTENVDTTDNFNIRHKSSITAQQFNDILEEYNSPAAGIGDHVVAYGNDINVDAAYALYMFIHESTAGTACPGWAGCKDGGDSTHNPGNIICAGYSSCYNGFRDYPTWEDGFDALLDLLQYYNQNLGDETMEQAVYRWAPPSENDTNRYYASLEEHVRQWRSINKGQFIDTTITENQAPAAIPAVIQTIAENINNPSPFMPADGEKFVQRQQMYGCLADTIPNALEPSPLLQDVIIGKGRDFSFNESWVLVDPSSHFCGNIDYGGICDMASTYLAVGRQMGLETVYQRHTGGLRDYSYEESVSILSSGVRGGQDLVLINNTSKVANMHATIEGNDLVVTGWWSDI